MLRTYEPTQFVGHTAVTVNRYNFRFSVAARNAANLLDIHWMRVHTDPHDRLVVFEPFAGLEKVPGTLKLGTQRRGYKVLTAKGLIAQTSWIRAVSVLNAEQRRFELKRYPGPIPPTSAGANRARPSYYIQLMPAFEQAVAPSQIGTLPIGTKGIYRYWSGNELVYIGKGDVRDRYQHEVARRDWNISKIEYSVIEDEQQAFEWESWWIERFRQDNNGHLPIHNLVRGRGSEREKPPSAHETNRAD